MSDDLEHLYDRTYVGTDREAFERTAAQRVIAETRVFVAAYRRRDHRSFTILTDARGVPLFENGEIFRGPVRWLPQIDLDVLDPAEAEFCQGSGFSDPESGQCVMEHEYELERWAGVNELVAILCVTRGPTVEETAVRIPVLDEQLRPRLASDPY